MNLLSTREDFTWPKPAGDQAVLCEGFCFSLLCSLHPATPHLASGESTLFDLYGAAHRRKALRAGPRPPDGLQHRHSARVGWWAGGLVGWWAGGLVGWRIGGLADWRIGGLVD